jgi:uncharacterized protein
MFRLEGGLLLNLYPRSELAKDARSRPGPRRAASSASATSSQAEPTLTRSSPQAEAAGATITDEPHDRP